MSRIIFLDIDGPMLPLRAYVLSPGAKPFDRRFDPCAVAMVNRLCIVTHAKLVISSNWAMKGRDFVVAALARSGITHDRLHSDWTTPRGADSGSWSRGAEVLRWVANHPEVTHWVSFDDEEIESPNAVTVTIEEGMMQSHFLAAAALLGLPLDEAMAA